MKLCLSVLALLFAGTGCGALGSYSQMMAQPGGAQAANANGTPGATGAPAGTGSGLASSSASDGSGSSSSGPSTVSVNIRNSCGKTVKVFFGDKPKFGSGTYSTADSNSVSSHTFKPGEQFWVVDESENGLASVSVKDATHEIEITGDCRELAQR